RYLNDEPVLACPPSAMYRFRKFARRNNRALATGAALVLMFLAVFGAVTWKWREADLAWQSEARERLAAKKAQTEAETARNQALAAAEDKRKALEEVKGQRNRAELHREHLQKNLRNTLSFVEGTVDRIKRSESAKPELKQEIVQSGLRFFEGFVGDRSDDPASRLQRGMAEAHRGNFCANVLGEPNEGDNCYARAAAIFQQLASDFPSDHAVWMELGEARYILSQFRTNR